MTPIDIQVSRSKVSVEGQAYSLYVGEGGISVLQTAIFYNKVLMYPLVIHNRVAAATTHSSFLSLR